MLKAKKLGWVVLWSLVCVSASAFAAEAGLVTALSGNAKLKDDKSVITELKPFVKLKEGDRVIMDGVARVQVVYFEGGRQETWLGSGELAIGGTTSKVLKGNLQSETKTLPAILVKQLTKTPSAEGNVKTGMIRLRSIPSREKTEAAESEYARLRSQADESDRNPELYLLSSYLELHEYDKLESFLKQLGEKYPNDSQILALTALYTKAANEAQGK